MVAKLDTYTRRGGPCDHTIMRTIHGRDVPGDHCSPQTQNHSAQMGIKSHVVALPAKAVLPQLDEGRNTRVIYVAFQLIIIAF